MCDLFYIQKEEITVNITVRVKNYQTTTLRRDFMKADEYPIRIYEEVLSAGFTYN